ncbi:MAG: phosphatase [Leptolyngbya sp. SIO3F4]|nr:phosphatase [Leptolyngbya sp. SIO3F4]
MKPVKTSVDDPIAVDFMESDVIRAPGRIGMTMAPGKQDEDSEAIWKRDLDTDLARLKDELGVSQLVCLLEDEEMSELGIPDLLQKTNQLGIETTHFPVDDNGKPDSMDRFKQVVSSATAALEKGNTVLIHCKGGKGRTGMLAAACLVAQGYSPEEAINTVKQYRDGALTVQIKCDAVHDYAEMIL